MRWLMACVILMTSAGVFADDPIYGELQLGAGGVRHSELSAYPVFGSLTLGAFMVPNIGIEVFADSGILDDKSGRFKLETESAYGIALRFQSPPKNGLSGFIVLGAVKYTINQQLDVAGATPVNEEFTGMRASVGINQRLALFPNLLLTAEYRHYNADEPIRVDAIMIGWRVNAQ